MKVVRLIALGLSLIVATGTGAGSAYAAKFMAFSGTPTHGPMIQPLCPGGWTKIPGGCLRGHPGGARL
jgi:hypothetical protein